MFPENNLSNKIFGAANPQFCLKQFVANAAQNEIVIDQAKTLSDFTVGFNSIVVGLSVTSFIPKANQSFPQGEHFLITGVRGFDGADASVPATPWVAGWGDGLAMNGSFTVNNNGSDVLKDQPFTVFQKGTNSPDAGWLLLSKHIMWKAQTPLTCVGTWVTPPATANLNGRIEFSGLKLI